MDGAGARRVMPFHALFLTLVVPLFAAAILLFAFGADAPLGPAFLAALPPVYLFGAVPTLLGALLDRRLAAGGVSPALRLVIGAGLAAAAGLLIVAPLLATGRVQNAFIFLFPAGLALAAFAALFLAMVLERVIHNRRARVDRTPPSETS